MPGGLSRLAWLWKERGPHNLLTRQTDHTPHRKGSRFWAGPGANDVNGAVEKGRWRYQCSGSHEGLVS